MKYVLGGGKNRTTQYKQPDWRHAKACMTSQFQRYLLSCAVWILSSTHTHTQKAWFLGAPRASVSESSRFTNRIKWLWKHPGVKKGFKKHSTVPTFPHAPATRIWSSGSETQIVSQLSKQAEPRRPKPCPVPCHCIFCLLQMASLTAAPLGGGPIFKVGDLIHLTHVCTHIHTLHLCPLLYSGT